MCRGVCMEGIRYRRWVLLSQSWTCNFLIVPVSTFDNFYCVDSTAVICLIAYLEGRAQGRWFSVYAGENSYTDGECVLGCQLLGIQLMCR